MQVYNLAKQKASCALPSPVFMSKQHFPFPICAPGRAKGDWDCFAGGKARVKSIGWNKKVWFQHPFAHLSYSLVNYNFRLSICTRLHFYSNPLAHQSSIFPPAALCFCEAGAGDESTLVSTPAAVAADGAAQCPQEMEPTTEPLSWRKSLSLVWLR